MSFGKLTFTPLVKKLQELHGSRAQYARMEKSSEPQDRLTDFEETFLAGRDTFYWATIGSTGWPYVQHRGGPKGFLKVIDDRTIAFADYRGNSQHITPRYTTEEIRDAARSIEEESRQLRTENDGLRSELAAFAPATINQLTNHN